MAPRRTLNKRNLEKEKNKPVKKRENKQIDLKTKKIESLEKAQQELLHHVQASSSFPSTTDKSDVINFKQEIAKLQKHNKFLQKQNRQLSEMNATSPHIIGMSKIAHSILTMIRTAKKELAKHLDTVTYKPSSAGQKNNNLLIEKGSKSLLHIDNSSMEVDGTETDNKENITIFAEQLLDDPLKIVSNSSTIDATETENAIALSDMVIKTEVAIENVTNPILQQSLQLNEQVECISFGGVLVSKKTLQNCHPSKVSKLTTDLMTVIFSQSEMAESSLTGKIANMHKSRNKCGEVREKKQLDPLKTRAIIDYVQQQIQGSTETEIKNAMKGKLKYEAQKLNGVGFKKSGKPNTGKSVKKEVLDQDQAQ
ncbi:uncharacterized protein [Temnothorax longispinosus]|uniref:uncharacterized protein n=2 Tax=Temnothorax TaxID=300110 RepID=UPI003A992BFB